MLPLRSLTKQGTVSSGVIFEYSSGVHSHRFHHSSIMFCAIGASASRGHTCRSCSWQMATVAFLASRRFSFVCFTTQCSDFGAQTNRRYCAAVSIHSRVIFGHARVEHPPPMGLIAVLGEQVDQPQSEQSRRELHADTKDIDCSRSSCQIEGAMRGCQFIESLCSGCSIGQHTRLRATV